MRFNHRIPFGRKLEDVIIPNEVVRDKKIGVFEKVCFGILLRDVDLQGRCIPSIKRLAGFLSCSEIDAQLCLDHLRAACWINWIDRSDEPRLYRLYSSAEHNAKDKNNG